jgi:hypothetical protein
MKEVPFKTLLHLMYAAYFCGAMTVGEGKLLTHPDAVSERRRFKELILKELV